MENMIKNLGSKGKYLNPRLRIELDTPLVPQAAAQAVLEEASGWLGEELPRAWIGVLTEMANSVYAHNTQFRRIIRRSGEAGRDGLWTFMRHWMAGLLYHHQPHLYARLPSSYQVGHPLPPPLKKSAPAQRIVTVRRIPPVKRRSRPAPDYAFAAAAHFHFM